MYIMFLTLLVSLSFLLLRHTAIASSLLPRDVSSAKLPDSFTLQRELGKSLSKHAAVYFPGQAQYTNLTARFAENITPGFFVSVDVGSAADVKATVKFARKYNIDFLAVNRGHGTATALSNVKHGIQINLRQLNDIAIAADGNSATLGGGVNADDLITALHARGKSSGSGAAGCVGLMGAGLGGGLGRYEGYYGLVLDNIIDMNVVLADGTSVFVSNTSNPDLYWAMRGAGHNFGIVTQLTYRIHDEISPTWYLSTMVFEGAKVEHVITLLNNQIANGTMPPEVINYALYAMDPIVSTTVPVIIVDIFYIGTAEKAVPWVQPYWDLGPVSIQNFTATYPGIFYAAGNGRWDAVCQEPQAPTYLYPIGLQTYNISTMVEVHKRLGDKIRQQPLFNQSNVMLEGYSLAAVKAVDPASTAYPHRDDNILVGFLVRWPENTGLDAEAAAWGSEIRSLIQSGVVPPRPASAYVNYAHGDEPLEDIYGHEPWRLEKLRSLKKLYDPDFQFKFYNPIQ